MRSSSLERRLGGVRWLAVLLAPALVCAWAAATSAREPSRTQSTVAVLELDGAIHPASLRYVERGLREAAEANAALVILELDTPGGLLVSLREMTTAITSSPVPVAVYVAPPGARAASAGFFLLMAADVAAMAPGTNTGAAHPVSIGGGGDAGKDQLAKATEDAAALVRALASRHGRSTEWAEKAVRESLSYTAEEARQHDLIEVIAPDRAALLASLDGMATERTGSDRHPLQLAGAAERPIEPTWSERILMVLADPQVAYLLLMAGLLGLFIEFTNPGLLIPGIAGVISLLIALYAFSILPVNWVGVLLMLVGLGLVVAEIAVTSYGALAIAGLVCFVLGSVLLVDTPIPELRISLPLVLPVTLVLGTVSGFLAWRALRLQNRPSRTGAEGMVGETGQLVRAIDPTSDGTVIVHGEYWSATSALPVPAGARVRVDRIEGRRLQVSPIETPST